MKSHPGAPSPQQDRNNLSSGVSSAASDFPLDGSDFGWWMQQPQPSSTSTLMAPNNSRASAAMALMLMATSVPPSAPAAENESLVPSRERQEDRDEPVFQKQACSVDEGVTARHPFADLGNTPTAATAAAPTTAGPTSLGGSAEELTPKKPSTTSKKRSKSTEEERTTATTEAKTTIKKKKKTQRKPTPAVNSLKDAKSELGTNDVVMGRGGLANHHAGNNSFRILTASMKPEYARLPKEEKTDVSRRLLDIVHARGGKFLAKDSVSGLFYEVENKTARRKCSQALREENKEERAARKSRKVSEAQSEEDEDDEDEEEDGEGTI